MSSEPKTWKDYEEPLRELNGLWIRAWRAHRNGSRKERDDADHSFMDALHRLAQESLS